MLIEVLLINICNIYMIIMYRYLNNNLKIRKGLFDVKCSKALIDELIKLDLEPIMYRTGNSYMYRKSRELNLDFSGEYSGHMWFGDRFFGIDDGIYSVLRMVEVLSNQDKTLNELCDNISVYYSTDELKVKTTEENKYNIVNKVKEYCISKNYKFNDIDGVRVEFEDGWALVRVSNTGPHVTIRYEAHTKERLENIQKEYDAVVNSVL